MQLRTAIGGCYLFAAINADMELGVLDPQSCWKYGSQPFVMYINDIENYNSNKLAFRFDASGKGAYGQWGGYGWCCREVDVCWWSRRMEDRSGVKSNISWTLPYFALGIVPIYLVGGWHWLFLADVLNKRT